MMEKNTERLQHGIFTVSLDFELYWGVRDHRSIDEYRSNLEGVAKAIPELLEAFNKESIHATWAVVGFLFFENSDKLKKGLPQLLPSYCQQELSPYNYIDDSIVLDPTYHFAPTLIEQIKDTEGQEIGSHTFSHYYCLEKGQTIQQFDKDAETLNKIAQQNDISIKSFVFPRNQWNSDYLSVLSEHGIKSFRGTESSWMYKASDGKGQSKIQRVLRLIDTYINLSGSNTYDLPVNKSNLPFNLPSSRFLRPYSKKLGFLDGFRLRRIKKAIEFAAINKRVFHLWWHPHNFGVNTKENIDFLTEILKHYNMMKERYGMQSLNMGEISDLIEAVNEQ